jgi:hypothetical protein
MPFRPHRRVALDGASIAWSLQSTSSFNNGNSTSTSILYQFNNAGHALSGAAGYTLSVSPSSLAIDGSGNLWLGSYNG